MCSHSQVHWVYSEKSPNIYFLTLELLPLFLLLLLYLDFTLVSIKDIGDACFVQKVKLYKESYQHYTLLMGYSSCEKLRRASNHNKTTGYCHGFFNTLYSFIFNAKLIIEHDAPAFLRG